MNHTLDLLMQLAHGISSHFGTSCEVLIHDLRKRDIDSSIVYIENGHISKRAIGDGPSGIVLEALKNKPEKLKDKLSYLTKSEDGRILKSSTMFIRGENDSVDYIFSLNYDITGLVALDSSIRSLIETEQTANNAAPNVITHNVNDLLDTLIEQSVIVAGKPVALMTKEDKINAIAYLNDAGAFLITKSGDKVSNYFGISKFTLYSYIDSAKQMSAEADNKEE